MRSIWILFVIGCAAPSALTCPDGLLCAPNTVCAQVAGSFTCIDPIQEDRCDGKTEGDACNMANDHEHCVDGVCIDLCGNTRIDPGEECDEGDRNNGDGCSDLCLLERCGNGAIDGAEQCDAGLANVSGGGCSSTCQLEVAAWHDLTERQWAGAADFATAWDEARRDVVVFGGLGPAGISNETWLVHDGTWHRADPPRTPSPREGAAMAYYPTTKSVILFGGYTGNAGVEADTWEWDGHTWIERPTTTAPSPRRRAVMAYDSTSDRMILFGGDDVDNPLSDTWAWDGSSWTQLSPAHAPMGSTSVAIANTSAPTQIVMCSGAFTYRYENNDWINAGACPADFANRMEFDRVRARFVLLSGQNVYESINGAGWSQTDDLGGAIDPVSPLRAFPGMVWDGIEVRVIGGHMTNYDLSIPRFFDSSLRRDDKMWVGDPNPTSSPTRRQWSAAAYDTRRGRELMFGGYDDAIPDDTWVFDRGGWRQYVTEVTIFKPPGLVGAAMAYDEVRDEALLFGGVAFGNQTPSDTAYLLKADGTNDVLVWMMTAPSTKPVGRAFPSMAYDNANHSITMFGGSSEINSGFLNDTWMWNNGTWTKLADTGPSPRHEAAMAYDPIHKRIVLFGGSTGTTTYANDTWTFDGATWTELHPDGELPPARGSATLVYDAARRKMLLFGGGTAATDHSYFSDVWDFDGTRWTKVIDDPHLTRIRHISFWDAYRHGLVTFGGETGVEAHRTNDTWILRWDSIVPHETCVFPDDDLDGDTLKGCDDPDCWSRCRPLCPPGTNCMPVPGQDPQCGDHNCDPQEDTLLCPIDCP